MESIMEFSNNGYGLSSSHTKGLRKAAQYFLSHTKEAYSCEIIQFGSLAANAKGHLTPAASTFVAWLFEVI